MKAIFEFILPEEQDEYDIHSQSKRMQSFVCDLGSQLRIWDKYGHPFKDVDDTVNSIRKQFYILANQHNVDIEL